MRRCSKDSGLKDSGIKDSGLKDLGLAIIVVCLALGLAACGKKMPPQPPDGSTYPRQYPKPE